MLDIGTLDTIIAMVIVLLVLSLIVQSVQSLIKKLLKLKSSIVLDSMQDLFKYIDTKKLVGKSPDELVAEVTEEFKKLGRVSLILKNPMLDSIAKGDLQKILNRLVYQERQSRLVNFLITKGVKSSDFPAFLASLGNAQSLESEVETWFDTVMQSFDERYTRHMKSVALIVAFLVVIFLNANFFNIYRNIAASDVLRAQILRQGPEVQKQAAAANKASANAQPSSNQPAGAATPGAQSSPRQSRTAATPTPQPSPTGTPDAAKNETQQPGDDIKDVQRYVGLYEGFGFTPLRPRQVYDFFNATGAWQGATRGQRFVHALKVLLGWAIMALLLSVGAPFWQDTLESLFGLKSLIRQKTKTQNVEEDEKGQQKP